MGHRRGAGESRRSAITKVVGGVVQNNPVAVKQGVEDIIKKHIVDIIDDKKKIVAKSILTPSTVGEAAEKVKNVKKIKLGAGHSATIDQIGDSFVAYVDGDKIADTDSLKDAEKEIKNFEKLIKAGL